MRTDLTLGEGRLLIGVGSDPEGKSLGIIITPLAEGGPVGAPMMPPAEVKPEDDGVCIWAANLDGVRVLQDAVNELVSHLQSCKPASAFAPKNWEGRNHRGFVAFFHGIQAEVHENSRAHGWWDTDRNDGEAIALMHSELSEALEGLRHGNPPSDHIPQFTAVEEELADTIIRIMDLAQARGARVAEAIIAKMAFNQSRPHKHGKKF